MRKPLEIKKRLFARREGKRLKESMMTNFLPPLPGAFFAPTRRHLIAIETEMLWPDDLLWKKRASETAHVEFMYELGAGDLKKSKDAFPIKYIRDELKKERFIRGLIVGSVLHKLLEELQLINPDATKSKIVEDCIKKFSTVATNGKIRVSEKTFNNEIWPAFRSVAHFWAAYYTQMIDGNNVFPCRVDGIIKFLSDAEFYRINGEKTRLRNSKSTILNAGETCRLPPGCNVPPSRIEFISR